LNRIKNILNLSEENKDILVFISLFVLMLAVYVNLLGTSAFYSDSSELVVKSYTLGIPHEPGYPIYTWMAHLFTMLPIGNVAYRVNLMSAFFGALSVSLIYLIVLNIVRIVYKKKFHPYASSFISVTAALSLAFSRTFWSQAEIAEVYTFNAFFVCIMILLLLKWAETRNIKLLYMFSLFYGLSLGAHISNILFAPAFLAFIVLTDKKIFFIRRNMAVVGLVFLLGASQYLYLFSGPDSKILGINSIEKWIGYVSGFDQFQSYYFAFNVFENPQRIAVYTDLLKINFFILGLGIGIIGMWELFKRNFRIFALLFLMFSFNIWFFIQTSFWDINVMLIPSFVIFSIFLGFGANVIVIFMEKSLCHIKASVAKKYKDYLRVFKKAVIITLIITFMIIPLMSYFLNYSEAERLKSTDYGNFVSKALDEIPENSVIITDWAYFYVYKYYQIVEKLNQHVDIEYTESEGLMKALSENIYNRRVFVHPYYMDTGSSFEKYDAVPFIVFPDGTTLYEMKEKE